MEKAACCGALCVSVFEAAVCLCVSSVLTNPIHFYCSRGGSEMPDWGLYSTTSLPAQPTAPCRNVWVCVCLCFSAPTCMSLDVARGTYNSSSTYGAYCTQVDCGAVLWWNVTVYIYCTQRL